MYIYYTMSNDNNTDNDNDNDNESFMSCLEDDADDETDVQLLECMEEEDWYEIETQAKQYIDEYISDNLVGFSSPLFASKIAEDVAETILPECSEEEFDQLKDWATKWVEEYFCMVGLPPRQEEHHCETGLSISEAYPHIERILAESQHKQRTAEWYESRHNMLTASNLWKVFGSQAQYNSLVYEKCKPINTFFMEKRSQINVDSDNPLHVGIKYEPLSVQLYEQRFGAKVSDVGCITHPAYPYLGASPDGVHTDPALPLYGRMIEVKNIVNREITGIPLESYWIQMQVQMEVCDLEECDFIETRFMDITEKPADDCPEQTGKILYLIPRSHSEEIRAEYVYMPLDIATFSEADTEWTEAQRVKYAATHILYKTSYWRLDQFSCILVRRNREWFAKAQPKIAEMWETIVRERETGYEHRAAVSRKVKPEVVCSDTSTSHYIRNMPFSSNVCLVKLG